MHEQHPTNERLAVLLDELLIEVRRLRDEQAQLANDVRELMASARG